MLSLDAPIVAVVWQDFVARCYPSPLLPQGRWVLGLTVWAIYLADRLVDVRHPASAAESTRHGFYRRYNTAARLLLGAVVLTDVLVSLLWLRPAVFSNGVLLGTAVLCYLAVFAGWRFGGVAWKQPSAALLFTVGVFLIAWTVTANPWRDLTFPAAAFAALCLGNLRLVEGESAGWIPMLLLAAGCLIGAAFSGSNWLYAIAMSAVGLSAVDLFSDRLSRDARGVLADAVLLAPLLFR